MTGRSQLALVSMVLACCAGKVLLTGVLAAGGVLPTSPWLVAAAVALLAVGVWQTTGALRRRAEGS